MQKYIKYNYGIIFTMNIQISDKKKKDVFVSVFQVLKNCTSLVSYKYILVHTGIYRYVLVHTSKT